MDFDFSWEQQELKAAAESLSKREIEPLLASYDPDKPLPREACIKIMQSLKQLGLLGTRVPIDLGGNGWGAVELGIFAESIPYDALCIGYSSAVLATRIALGGSQELKRNFLPPILAGEKLTGNATSEAQAGSDLQGIETTAVLAGDEYVLNGTKLWVSNGEICDILSVAASTGKDEKGRKKLSIFLLEKDKSPFSVRVLPMFGHTQGHLAEIVLNDCRVPKENMFTEATGHAGELLTTTWLAQRPTVGLFGIYCAKKALNASIEYAQTRSQFGKVIGRFQLIQRMIAEMAILVDASRLLCYRALDMVDKGQPRIKEATMAKAFATEAAVKVTSMAMQIYGAYGISREYPLEKYFRDARMFTYPDGTTEISHLIIGREILDLSAFR
jgi:alkylation response protein AidB-like acyl-CoA dehydrogenase